MDNQNKKSEILNNDEMNKEFILSDKINNKLDVCDELLIDEIALKIIKEEYEEIIYDTNYQEIEEITKNIEFRNEMLNCSEDVKYIDLDKELMSKLGIDINNKSTWKNDKLLEYQKYLINKYNLN